MISTAYNFNSEATIADDESCILKVDGCSLYAEGYHEVDPLTPGYRDLYVGLPLRSVGKVPFAGYGAVKEHVPGSTDPSSCVPVVEGCMDAAAANYDPLANTNSGTWCIPKVAGCMMPTVESASPGAFTPGEGKHSKNGLALDFDAAATVSVPCTVLYYGCTDPSAANYEANANADDGSCMEVVAGCLNKRALNFNCTEVGDSACNGTTPRVTLHEAGRCNYYRSPPPAPPRPRAPPGSSVLAAWRADVAFKLAGNPAERCQDADAMATTLAASQRAYVSGRVGCRAGSVLISFPLAFLSEGARDALVSSPWSRRDLAAIVGIPVDDVLDDPSLVANGEEWLSIFPPAPPPPPSPPPPGWLNDDRLTAIAAASLVALVLSGVCGLYIAARCRYAGRAKTAPLYVASPKRTEITVSPPSTAAAPDTKDI